MSYFERGDNNHSAVINSPAPTDYTIRDGGRVPYSIDGVPTTQFVNYDPKYYRKDNWLENTDKNQNYVTTLGNSTPLRNEEIGYKKPETTLLPLHWNPVSHDCCPSTFSTSRGCICTSNKQRDFIGMYRGGNRTHYSEF